MLTLIWLDETAFDLFISTLFRSDEQCSNANILSASEITAENNEA